MRLFLRPFTCRNLQLVRESVLWTWTVCAVSCVFGCFADVASCVLDFAFNLICQTFGLLFLAVHQFAGAFLDFAANFFQFAFDLVFIHGDLLWLAWPVGDAMNTD
jgi:predicted Co/Zn/Cd cation transporter (cation efflux family)